METKQPKVQNQDKKNELEQYIIQFYLTFLSVIADVYHEHFNWESYEKIMDHNCMINGSVKDSSNID